MRTSDTKCTAPPRDTATRTLPIVCKVVEYVCKVVKYLCEVVEYVCKVVEYAHRTAPVPHQRGIQLSYIRLANQ